MNAIKKILSSVTRTQCVEFGQVCVGVALCFALYLKESDLVIIALILTLVSIVVPRLFFPFAVLWFGLAKLLNTMSTTLIMTMVFFLIVCPVALLRQLMGKDSLRLKEFKKNKDSVMHDRDRTYTKEDFLHTF